MNLRLIGVDLTLIETIVSNTVTHQAAGMAIPPTKPDVSHTQ